MKKQAEASSLPNHCPIARFFCTFPAAPTIPLCSQVELHLLLLLFDVMPPTGTERAPHQPVS